MGFNRYQIQAAIQDFQSARQRAALEEVLSRLQGKSTQLLSYDEVAQKLKLRARSERGIQQVPLDAIVGSVGRYTDFSRTFLPLRAEDQDRWARVKAATEGELGLPPAELYKVGEVYFVLDGNHRVSVARQLGAKTIEAHVTEFRTDVPLTPDIQPDDLISKAEYAEFLETTNIQDLRPNVDLSVTVPGQYEKLKEQIEVRKYLFEQERGAEVSFQEAVEDWYDNVYIPLAEAIRDRDLLHWFPNRTITDLFLWISEHRADLENEGGWEIQSNISATDLILEKSGRTRKEKAGSGSWRKARMLDRYTENLFKDVLVPLSGSAESWDALEQAILLARREQAKLHGLHVVDSQEDLEGANALEVQARFKQVCDKAGVDGKLVIEPGDITKKICERAVVTDLIVLKVAHPPQGGLSSFTSPFRTIITSAARPLLGVPGKAHPLERALLAFDGSVLAKEALFVATYLAEVWKTHLIVFTALESGSVKPEAQEYVRRYLEVHEVKADYLIVETDAMQTLLKTVKERQVDLVFLGGYTGSVLREMIIGSSLNYMLRESKVPLFICR